LLKTSDPKISPPAARSIRERALIAFVALWLIGISIGSLLLLRYSLKPGAQGTASVQWPADLALARVRGRPTLVMFVHPKCACSRASLSELAVLVADCPSGLSTDIVFADPPGLVRQIESNDLWQSAAEIPDSTLICDRDGAIARRLGAHTSGQVFLYDAQGTLRFSGGITAERAHAGSNAGRLAIEAIIRNEKPIAQATPVFGCSLW